MGQFSDRRLKFVSSYPIPKKTTKMSEEVKTDAAPAEVPSAEDLKGQKRSIEAEAVDGEIKKQKTENGANGEDAANGKENGSAAEEEADVEEEEEGDEEEDLDEEDEELDGEEEEDGEGEEEDEDEEDA